LEACAVALTLLAFTAMLAGCAAEAQRPDWVSEGKYVEYKVYIQSDAPQVPKGEVGTLRLEIVRVYDRYAEVNVRSDVLPEARSYVPFSAGYEMTWYYESDGFALSSASLSELAQGRPPKSMLDWFERASMEYSVGSELKSVPGGTFDCYKVSAWSQGEDARYDYWFDKKTGLIVAFSMGGKYQGYWLEINVELSTTNIASPLMPPMAVFGLVIIAIVVVVMGLVVIVALRLARRGKLPQTTSPQPPPFTPPPATSQ